MSEKDNWYSYMEDKKISSDQIFFVFNPELASRVCKIPNAEFLHKF